MDIGKPKRSVVFEPLEASIEDVPESDTPPIEIPQEEPIAA
jgi:hypothetical protein